MHEQAALDFHPQDRPQAPIGIGQLAPDDIRAERRLDRVPDDLGDVSFHVLLPIRRDPDDLPCLPGNAKRQHSAACVRERGQFVGQFVPARLRDHPV